METLKTEIYLFVDENKTLQWHFEYVQKQMEDDDMQIENKFEEWTHVNENTLKNNPFGFSSLDDIENIPEVIVSNQNNNKSFKKQKKINEFFKEKTTHHYPEFLSSKSFNFKKIELNSNETISIYIENGLLDAGIKNLDKMENHYDVFPKSVWYSNLQKLTRNSKTWSCCKVAKYLIEKDLNHFCRRYMIIMMEDSEMKKEIPILAALMMFTNRIQTKVSNILMKHLLYIVASVSPLLKC